MAEVNQQQVIDYIKGISVMELSALVMRCLSKPADTRYQTGAELADALLAYLMTVGSPGETRSAWFSRRGGGASATPA